MALKENEIGGARVRQTFRRGTEQLKSGSNLTRAEVLAIPRANRNALIDSGKLEVYPLAPEGKVAPAGPTGRFVVRTPGFGVKTFDVIEGTKVATGLSKAEAEALAGVTGEDPPN